MANVEFVERPVTLLPATSLGSFKESAVKKVVKGLSSLNKRIKPTGLTIVAPREAFIKKPVLKKKDKRCGWIIEARFTEKYLQTSKLYSGENPWVEKCFVLEPKNGDDPTLAERIMKRYQQDTPNVLEYRIRKTR